MDWSWHVLCYIFVFILLLTSKVSMQKPFLEPTMIILPEVFFPIHNESESSINTLIKSSKARHNMICNILSFISALLLKQNQTILINLQTVTSLWRLTTRDRKKTVISSESTPSQKINQWFIQCQVLSIIECTRASDNKNTMWWAFKKKIEINFQKKPREKNICNILSMICLT